MCDFVQKRDTLRRDDECKKQDTRRILKEGVLSRQLEAYSSIPGKESVG